MSRNVGKTSEILTLPEKERIDRLCDSFETAWRDGDSPRIEDYLRAVNEANHATFLRELIALEVELRHKDGDYPAAAEYRRRFADSDRIVAEVFHEPDASAGISETNFLTDADVDLEKTRDANTFPFLNRIADHPFAEAGHGVRTLGDYLVGERLGSGGMGVVYKAYHRRIRRNVALKVILAEWGGETTEAGRSGRIERFRNEAQTLASLEHDHIIPVYDVGHIDGHFYFAMQFINGRDLNRILKSEGALECRKAAYYVEAIANAIHFAHSHKNKIIHRDVKPHNIMIGRNDRPILIDLGLAKALESSECITEPGSHLGTPEYMSPEQANAGDVGVAADVYGLGATLFALLCGHPPFTGSDPLVVLRKVVDEEPVWPRKAEKRIDRDLKAICLKCLEKDPANRFKSAGDLALALNSYLNHSHEGIPTLPGPWTLFKKWCKRQPWRAAAAALAIFAATTLPAIYLWKLNQDRATTRALIHDVNTVPLRELSRKVVEMVPYRGRIDPELQTLLQQTTPDTDPRTRLLLALLPSEPSLANELIERLISERCEPEEHAVIREALREHWPKVAQRALAVLNDQGANPEKRTRAAAALIALGVPEPSTTNPAWSVLGWSSEPDARTRLVDWLILSKIEPMFIYHRLERENDLSIRRSLTQILGALGDGAMPKGADASLVARFKMLYHGDPDPGMHSSLAYLLRRWGFGDDVKKLDEELAGKPPGNRGWFVNTSKMTMVILGGPEDEWLPSKEGRPAHKFAIATTETLLTLYQEFDKEHQNQRTEFNIVTQALPNLPVDYVNYYQCAEFCNWLSQKEGLPEDQWCYIPGVGPGEWLLSPDSLSKSGYRLPDVEEWEYAARAGTISAEFSGADTDRYFGMDPKIRRTYSWHNENTRFPKPVGLHQPNDFGLFDMIGNMMEWCYNPDPPHRKFCRCNAATGAQCQERGQSMKGGSFYTSPERQGSINMPPVPHKRGEVKDFSMLDTLIPTTRFHYSGFRVIQSLPRSNEFE